MAEWYRRKTWSKIDQDEFFLKLNRARKDGRAQYLRIQAIELLETKQAENVEAAESLLHKILIDYPEDEFEKSLVLNTLGEICQLKGKIDNALGYYLQSINFEVEYPNVQTHAYLDYSELIVKNKREECYDFVEKLVSSKITELVFPLEKYKVFSILAIINNYRNDIEKAIHFTELAEQNANATTSGFRYHKGMGLVEKRDVFLDSLVKRE